MPSSIHTHHTAASAPQQAEITEAQRVLAFTIGTQSYAVNILQVCEIRSYAEPLKISDAGADLLGLINLRGEMIPIIDLRLRLGSTALRYDETTSVIVVERGGRRFGAVVDDVKDVLDLNVEHVRPMPALPGVSSRGCFQGIASIDDQMLVLVDVAALVGPSSPLAIDALH